VTTNELDSTQVAMLNQILDLVVVNKYILELTMIPSSIYNHSYNVKGRDNLRFYEESLKCLGALRR